MSNCKSCHQPIKSDQDVMAEFLKRSAPKRIFTKWDFQELAEEALAIARSLGYAKEVSS